MLPESFAIVCAQKFTSNFGIFRLTDPQACKQFWNAMSRKPSTCTQNCRPTQTQTRGTCK
ncbi:hypothetical protein BDR06DRAFT_573785 [Suillus hirtellus]|nr:hypothetical protein BDR06DRAFT_573785 [Suillus hirtellus]